MTTKKLILQKSKVLFNRKGICNVTLREVAKELNKSYGNITYHYKTKENLLNELTIEFVKEFIKINMAFKFTSNLLETYNHLTELQYSLIKKYTFFFIDDLELKRNYQEVSKTIKNENLFLKELRIKLFNQLQENRLLKSNYNNITFEFLIEITKGITVLCFQQNNLKTISKEEYCKKNLKIIFPYLTDRGKLKYIKL